MKEPLLIAELGVNFQGVTEFETAIELAGIQGIRTLKGQYFLEEHLEGRPDREYLRKCLLSRDDVEHLIEVGLQHEVDVFFTPECEREMAELYDIGQKYMKISHVNAADKRMTDLASNHPDVPLFISVYKEELSLAARDLLFRDHDLYRLYCIGKYPPDIEELQLQRLAFFDGYSNHTPDILAPLIAYFYNACVIEVHVRRLDGHGIDDRVSVTWDDFVTLKQNIERAEVMAGWSR